MRVLDLSRHVALSALCALAVAASTATATAASSDDVIAALQVIERDADAIASGKYHGKSLQAPAHEIGFKWYKIEPVLAKDGAVLVEMRMANASITAFDEDWKHNRQARKSAKDVSEAVAQLLAAEKQSGEPASASPEKPTAAPAASPASLQSPSAEKPSPAPSTAH